MLRVLEMTPGFLAWGTLITLAGLSFSAPAFVALFIIAFDVYWLFKTVYLFLHLRDSLRKMEENKKIDWLAKLKLECGKEWSGIYHLIIFPMHKEPLEVVRGSFLNLVKSNYPLEKLIVVLGIEESAGRAAEGTAAKIQNEFGSRFFRFLTTKHPFGIPGDIPGKGSNETFASRQAKALIIDPQNIPYEDILVSVFDADTQVSPEYFGILTYKFLTSPSPQRASYQPVPLFLNNIFQAPALARIIAFSTTFWEMIQQSRMEQLTTYSSHSMPFKALVEIGFWQKDIVSEDSRIFWQCYLHYGGDWRVEPLFYPVSMDANAASSFWQTLINLYRQQRRHAWGVENIPYLLNGFRRNKKIPKSRKWYWGFTMLEGFHSWATNSLIIFFFGWLPIWLGGEVFRGTVLSYNLPRYSSRIMTIASLFLASLAFFSLVLLPARPPKVKWRQKIFYIFQWVLMPLTLIVFGALPALEAQTRLMLGGRFRLGFWPTPKSRR
mgnify:CR=1 FL=1